MSRLSLNGDEIKIYGIWYNEEQIKEAINLFESIKIIMKIMERKIEATNE